MEQIMQNFIKRIKSVQRLRFNKKNQWFIVLCTLYCFNSSCTKESPSEIDVNVSFKDSIGTVTGYLVDIKDNPVISRYTLFLDNLEPSSKIGSFSDNFDFSTLQGQHEIHVVPDGKFYFPTKSDKFTVSFQSTTSLGAIPIPNNSVDFFIDGENAEDALDILGVSEHTSGKFTVLSGPNGHATYDFGDGEGAENGEGADISIQVVARQIHDDDGNYFSSGEFWGELFVSNDLINWKLLDTDGSCTQMSGRCGTFYFDLNDINYESARYVKIKPFDTILATGLIYDVAVELRYITRLN